MYLLFLWWRLLLAIDFIFHEAAGINAHDELLVDYKVYSEGIGLENDLVLLQI